jgi:hypothetical protein
MAQSLQGGCVPLQSCGTRTVSEGHVAQGWVMGRVLDTSGVWLLSLVDGSR